MVSSLRWSWGHRCRSGRRDYSRPLTIASWVLYIVWSFKAKAALQEYALNEHKIDLRMNAFYTFIFTIYYINYCVNDLPEAKRKQEILSGQPATTES